MLDMLKTPLRRRLLFAALYLSEGAPIGFLWLALPTRLRAAGVALEEITWLTATLVLPWTFKFAWAPLVDLLRGRRWTLRHWVISCQLLMGLTLAPLVVLDLQADFALISWLLLLHAFAAATQDVAIDALCISVTDPLERGRLNGWMQAGMMSGRALLGGGALLLAAFVGEPAVVVVLIGVTTFSALLVAMSQLPDDHQTASLSDQSGVASALSRTTELRQEIAAALRRRSTWLGLLFALIGGASFKSLEVILGPFLVDRSFAKETIGAFSAGPMILAMIAGAVAGGWAADRYGHRRCVGGALCFLVAAIVALAVTDAAYQQQAGTLLLPFLVTAALGIGFFTTSSYALFMDLTSPRIAATQFSAFMGATNGCEAWSTFAIGQIVAWNGYPTGMLVMCAASLVALPLLWLLEPTERSGQLS